MSRVERPFGVAVLAVLDVIGGLFAIITTKRGPPPIIPICIIHK